MPFGLIHVPTSAKGDCSVSGLKRTWQNTLCRHESAGSAGNWPSGRTGPSEMPWDKEHQRAGSFTMKIAHLLVNICEKKQH